MRTTLAPMPSTPISCPPNGVVVSAVSIERGGLEFRFGGLRQLLRRLRDLHAAGRVEHRFDDVVVAGAAADIAFQLMPDRFLVELAAMAVHDIDRRHDHAGRAIAALKGKFIDEGLLQRMELAGGLLQSFNGRDTFAARFVGQLGTGADGRAVNQHCTCAANLDFAGDFSAVEIQRIAENFGKRFLRLAVYLPGFAI